jgi:hypothetical protein
MSDFRSKVTRRPRSKLERVVELLERDDMPPPTAAFAAAVARSSSAVAPTPGALRVATRLGYPGNEPASIARALDAEVPEGDVTSVAWRAHWSLHVLSEEVCHREMPKCSSCPARSACDFQGVGADPARRLSRPDDES